MPDTRLPQELAATMGRIYQERLTTPSGGNCSVRDGEGGLWVTPSQIDKGRLGPEDMVHIAADGTFHGRHAPTSEWPFHRAILDARPDLQAVVHAHPVSLVAFSVVGRRLEQAAFPDLCRWLGPLDFAPYAVPGSSHLGDVLGRIFAAGSTATLLENHGAVAGGRDLAEAFHRFQALEHLAAIHLGAARLGPPAPPSPSDLAQARQAMERPWTREAGTGPDAAWAREELADFVRRAHQRGLLGGRTGAFSVRCGDGFLIVPDGADRSLVRGADLVFVAGGRARNGHPDVAADLHEAVYARHPQVGALATALPPALMAFACTGRELDARIIPEAYMVLKRVPTLPFRARFEPAPLLDALGSRTPAALVQGACAVITGATPFAVFDRLEVAEATARSLLAAQALGPLKPLGEDVLEEVCRAYKV